MVAKLAACVKPSAFNVAVGKLAVQPCFERSTAERLAEQPQQNWRAVLHRSQLPVRVVVFADLDPTKPNSFDEVDIGFVAGNEVLKTRREVSLRKMKGERPLCSAFTPHRNADGMGTAIIADDGVLGMNVEKAALWAADCPPMCVAPGNPLVLGEKVEYSFDRCSAHCFVSGVLHSVVSISLFVTVPRLPRFSLGS